MNKFELGELFEAIGLLGNFGHTLAALASGPNRPVFHNEDDEKIRAAIDLVCSKTDELNLPITRQSADELRKMWPNFGDRSSGNLLLANPIENQKLWIEMQKVCELASRELKTKMFFSMSAEKAKYFKEPLFGAEVEKAFPEVSEDISEAGKCLAFDRATACVFHLMRVLESAATKIAAKIGATIVDKHGKGLAWGIIAENMKPRIDEMTKGSPEQVKWYRVQHNLVVVNRAWRVPTNHPKQTYTTEQAIEVFDATKAFMRELCALV